jgi:deoxyguanosine kinase
VLNESDWAAGRAPRHIAIEGPIGVGKTTLTRAIATLLDARMVIEVPSENPFLERFYSDARAWALPTQLTFLLQRARQARELIQPELFARTVVSDFIVEKDRIFAELTLAADELELYLQVYSEIMGGIPVPDLVIYLHAPIEILQARILARAIDYEQTISAEYLAELGRAYGQFFSQYHSAPLLIVDTTALNFAEDDTALHKLLSAAMQVDSGRSFLSAQEFKFGDAFAHQPLGWC